MNGSQFQNGHHHKTIWHGNQRKHVIITTKHFVISIKSIYTLHILFSAENFRSNGSFYIYIYIYIYLYYSYIDLKHIWKKSRMYMYFILLQYTMFDIYIYICKNFQWNENFPLRKECEVYIFIYHLYIE
jgi:hypothetical protein